MRKSDEAIAAFAPRVGETDGTSADRISANGLATCDTEAKENDRDDQPDDHHTGADVRSLLLGDREQHDVTSIAAIEAVAATESVKRTARWGTYNAAPAPRSTSGATGIAK